MIGHSKNFLKTNISAMNKLTELLRGDKRPLFMTHLIAGYPTIPASEKIGAAMIKGGADILELQIPFSDPMADGPSIAVACQEALKNGATVSKSLSVAAKLAKIGAPVLIMSYINPIFRYGIAKFVEDAAKAGVSGFIIPDAPFDSPEGIEFLQTAKKHDLHLIPLITPGVPRERLMFLSQNASGFVYCTSRQGITGANSKFAAQLSDYIQMAKKEFDIPLGLGFGVRTRSDFKNVAKLADVVIAGSVFVNAIKTSKSPEKAVLTVLRSLMR
jgi:tryptophan synthase alpha chain